VVIVLERVVKVYAAPAGTWPEFRPRPPFEITVSAPDLNGLIAFLAEPAQLLLRVAGEDVKPVHRHRVDKHQAPHPLRMLGRVEPGHAAAHGVADEIEVVEAERVDDPLPGRSMATPRY
jgi:hypothetical protein